MSHSSMAGMAIKGITACVPMKEVSNERDYPWFSSSEIRKVTGMVGVKSRRIADDQTCTSDLCESAAKRLISRLNWSPRDIDGLIFVTQTPDYVMPSTSCLLQSRLGISENCASFDVGLGCSAYVYGLWLANSLITSKACRRVLLLTGETPSKFVNPKDRATALLFGDAGTATGLEWTDDPCQTAHYILMTDGRGGSDLIVPGGGFRDRFPVDRDRCFVSMDGAHIFDFTRTRIPALIKEMAGFCGKSTREYDYFIFHQANEYLIKFIAGKSGVDAAKVPLSMDRYGNTGAASVPLTLAVAGMPVSPKECVDVMFLGFGVGLSWGAVSTRILKTCVLDHFEYTGNSV